MMKRSDGPAPDEFEISIIGPGIGESVVIHIGCNEWCIVDSCIARGSSESAAIEYLAGFKNGAEDRIRLIVATHWHDDHIRGLASIVRRSPPAPFYCSNSLRTEEFLTLVQTLSDGIQTQSGVDEFAEILELCRPKTKKEQARLRWALENQILLQMDGNGRPYPVSIIALSPSHQMVTKALQDIGALMPQQGQMQRRVPFRSPNRASVVLWIEAGAINSLLGADLENTQNNAEGWIAVLQCHLNSRGPKLASMFKVPHHGSANSDNQDVWPGMLQPSPIAVVTPFNAGRTKLPKESDLTRLLRRTDKLYLTSQGTGKVMPRDHVVEKMMKDQLKERRVLDGQPGHVRVRWSSTQAGQLSTVETFFGAHHVPPKNTQNQ